MFSELLTLLVLNLNPSTVVVVRVNPDPNTFFSAPTVSSYKPKNEGWFLPPTTKFHQLPDNTFLASTVIKF